MRQRVMIAIGLACNPKLIIADEPTTALDVTIQAQILELMKDLSRKLNIALIVITHNLGVVARYADRVIVMYASRLVEEGDADDVFHRPRHPYSMGLLRSVPRLDRPRGTKLETIEGLPPNAASPPPGCRFAPRCPYRIAICETEPGLLRTDTGGLSRCHRHQEIAEGKIVWAAAGADTQHLGAQDRRAAAVGPQPDQAFRGARRLARRQAAPCARSTTCRSTSCRARRWAWSANPAAARPRSAALILRLEEPTGGEIALRGRSTCRRPAPPR